MNNYFSRPMNDKITEKTKVYYEYYKEKYPNIKDIVLRRMICKIADNNMDWLTMKDYASDKDMIRFFTIGRENIGICGY